MGSLKIIPTIEPWQRELGMGLADIYGGAAPEIMSRIFERENVGSIVDLFKEHVVPAASTAWEKILSPSIIEGFNLPGAFYSRSKHEGVMRKGEEFLETRVMPQLFESIESMFGRETQRQAILANVLSGGTSLATAPTQTGVVKGKSGSSGSGGLIGATAGFGLGALAMGVPALGTFGLGSLGLRGPMDVAILGALLGGSFE